MTVPRLRAAGALACVALLPACSSDTVLVSGLPGAEVEHQNEQDALAPGATWCDEIGPGLYVRGAVVSSWFGFGDGAAAGATVVDRSSEGASSAYFLELIEERAAACAESAGDGSVIEELVGRADDERGWTTRTPDGEWGEYVVVQLDERRLLTVGFSTFEDEAPADLDDLVERAREGAQQVLPER